MVCLLNLQLCKQVSAEGGFIQRSVRAVPEGNRDLWAGKPSVCLLQILTTLLAHRQSLNHSGILVCVCQQVGTNTMDNPLLKYSAKEYFFKASLCHFIVDELNAKVSSPSGHRARIYIRRTAADNMHVFFLCCSSLLESMKRCFQPSRIQENASFWRFVMIQFTTYKNTFYNQNISDRTESKLVCFPLRKWFS